MLCLSAAYNNNQPSLDCHIVFYIIAAAAQAQLSTAWFMRRLQAAVRLGQRVFVEKTLERFVQPHGQEAVVASLQLCRFYHSLLPLQIQSIYYSCLALRLTNVLFGIIHRPAMHSRSYDDFLEGYPASNFSRFTFLTTNY